jgi:glycosyltransferase involved in cell wall biosynthesis
LKNTQHSLSVVIIAKNEARNIGKCLKSVEGLADEIIVFDSGSTDGTQEICRKTGAKVFETDWPGYGQQYNRALQEARCAWTFLLDADERASEKLCAEIRDVLQKDSTHTVFLVPMIHLFCGRKMRWGGYKPGRFKRFFKTGCCRFDDKFIHNRLLHEGSCGTFISPIMHNTAPDLSVVLDKTNRYSTLGAQQKQMDGKANSLGKAILYGFWVFLRNYFFRLGFLDGQQGFMAAVSKAEGAYYRGVKLLFLQRSATD